MECVNTPLACEYAELGGFTDMGFKGVQDGILGVSQPSHGFLVNTPVRYDADLDTWVVATSTTLSDGQVFGFVYEVRGVDSFKVSFRPYRTTTPAPVGTGNLVYIDDNGNLSRTPGTIVKAVGHVLKEGMILFPHMTDGIEGVGSVIGVTFETIAQNLYAYPFTKTRDSDGLTSATTYSVTGGGTIVKTVTRDSDGFATLHQLSGDAIPGSLTVLCKVYTRDQNGFVSSVAYTDCS